MVRMLQALLLALVAAAHGIAMPGVGFFARSSGSAIARSKVQGQPSSDAGFLDSHQVPGRSTFWLEDLNDHLRHFWRKALLRSQTTLDVRPTSRGSRRTTHRVLNSDVRMVPISWLKPHEQTIPTNLDLVHQQVVDAGAYTKPILVDRVTGTILDGHHRHAVGRRLGLTRLPALLIDYQSDPTIQLDVWPACGRTELTKQEVIDMALSPSVFPPKTSRHSFDGLDRENDLPEIDIPLRALSGKAYTWGKFQA